MGRLAMMVAAVVLAAPAGARADVVEVTGWQINVRERPNKSATVIVTLYRGERFELIERSGDWYHVRIPSTGRVGYVHSSLSRVIPGATIAAAAPEPPRPVAPRPAPVAPRVTTPEPAIPPPAPAPEPITPAPAPRTTYVPPPRQTAPPPPPPEPDVPQREGFWIGFGLGWGSASVSANDADLEGREGSWTGFLKMGGTLNDRVLLGVESNAWYKSENEGNLILGSLTGTVTYYPIATSGLFVKGGLGASYMSMDVFLGGVDTENIDKVGWGFLLGVGYDWRVGENISISPVLNYYYGKPGDIDFEGVRAFSGFSQNVIDFAVGVTFH